VSTTTTIATDAANLAAGTSVGTPEAIVRTCRATGTAVGVALSKQPRGAWPVLCATHHVTHMAPNRAESHVLARTPHWFCPGCAALVPNAQPPHLPAQQPLGAPMPGAQPWQPVGGWDGTVAGTVPGAEQPVAWERVDAQPAQPQPQDEQPAQPGNGTDAALAAAQANAEAVGGKLGARALPLANVPAVAVALRKAAEAKGTDGQRRAYGVLAAALKAAA
jgi:hypothetical protein